MAIDRKQLVSRHDPVIRAVDPYAPLSVGNGSFAFTADATGLQSFPEAYAGGIPLCTMAEWGWHVTPAGNERGRYDLCDLEPHPYETYGRQVGYPTRKEGQEEIYHWLRTNPHKFHLGRIGLVMERSDGARATATDLRGIDQRLDLWRGILVSRFEVFGEAVVTRVCCHPSKDALAISVASRLVSEGRLKIELAFAYGSPEMAAADWGSPERHTTVIAGRTVCQVDLARAMDGTRYCVRVAAETPARIRRAGEHRVAIEPASGYERITCVIGFSPVPFREALPTFGETVQASERHWERFWSQGGAVDLGESVDPRAGELERRIVLSQYLTAIQCAGFLPPQETGLTCNSWYGKFHLEMHWWHAVHFALWGREELLERSMAWYDSILERARATARRQGYRGVRWPKMVAFDGRESPSPIGPLLVWQQPHPIYYAELLYRARPCVETLERYRELVFLTAEFMASYAVYDAQGDRYVLGPPVIPAQENHAPYDTLNPTFELEYWAFGLHVANQWRSRLGLAPDPDWGRVAHKLAAPAARDGVYLAHERCPDTFTRFHADHPSMLGALGILPGWRIDRETMRRTLVRVLREWRHEQMWGWDFPMMAMTAARLGEPEMAVDALLMDSPKNTYLVNGHNRQGERQDLPLYLPGNGGVLTAVAMMAAGWDGAEATPGGTAGTAPGFPADGKWRVKCEGLRRMT